VRLAVPHQLVYEAHDYGPEVNQQSWFSDPTFPRNLPGLWDRHWGYLQREGIAPVLVGEFGGKEVDSGTEGAWIHALMDYIHAHQLSYTFWCLNPNSGDTGGLLEDDWKTVNPAKMALLRGDLAPPIASGTAAPQGGGTHAAQRAIQVRRAAAHPSHAPRHAHPQRSAAPARASHDSGLLVLYADGKPDPSTNNPSPNLRIVNDGAAPVTLSDLEIHYYFTAETLRGQSQVLDVDWASAGAGNVRGDFVHVSGALYYLRLRFAPAAGQIAPHGGSAEVKMRIHKPDWSAYTQQNDYSFGPPTTYTPWPHIPLYQRGRLVWGAAPAL
jgi:endoglucanase